jgi:hypothetical protein
LSSWGTYAPIKTPLRFAIIHASQVGLKSHFVKADLQNWDRPISRILCFANEAAIIHLAHLLPNGSSDLPGGRSKPYGSLWAGSPV